jgi:hypothetical protein
MSQKSSAKELLIRSVEINRSISGSGFVQKLDKKNTLQLDINIHKIFKIRLGNF